MADYTPVTMIRGNSTTINNTAVVDGQILFDETNRRILMDNGNQRQVYGMSTAEFKQQVLNTVYPVGSIYMSVNSTSPATFVGGTWTRLQDRYLVGAGSTYTAGSTGGSRTVNVSVKIPANTVISLTDTKTDGHQLTASETGQHYHTLPASGWSVLSTNESNSHTHDTALSDVAFHLGDPATVQGWLSTTGNHAIGFGVTRTSGGVSEYHHHQVDIDSTHRVADAGSGLAHSHGISSVKTQSELVLKTNDVNTAQLSNDPPYLAVYMWKRTA